MLLCSNFNKIAIDNLYDWMMVCKTRLNQSNFFRQILNIAYNETTESSNGIFFSLSVLDFFARWLDKYCFRKIRSCGLKCNTLASCHRLIASLWRLSLLVNLISPKSENCKSVFYWFHNIRSRRDRIANLSKIWALEYVTNINHSKQIQLSL